MIFHDVLKRNPAFFLDVIGIFFYSQSDSGGGRGGAERIFLTGVGTIREMGINRRSVIISGAAVVCGSAIICSVGIVCSAAFVMWRGIRPWRRNCRWLGNSVAWNLSVTVARHSSVARHLSCDCVRNSQKCKCWLLGSVKYRISSRALTKLKNGIACFTF